MRLHSGARTYRFEKVGMMSKTRFGLLSGSLGMIMGVAVMQFLHEELLVNGKSALSLIGAIVLMLALTCLSVWLMSVFMRALNRHGKEFKQYQAQIVGPGIAAVALITLTFAAVATTLNWGWGAAIRQMDQLSFLPEGNLVTVAGVQGWIYVMLIALAVGSAFIDKIPAVLKLLVTERQASSKLKRPKMKQVDDLVTPGSLRPQPVMQFGGGSAFLDDGRS